MKNTPHPDAVMDPQSAFSDFCPFIQGPCRQHQCRLYMGHEGGYLGDCAITAMAMKIDEATL